MIPNQYVVTLKAGSGMNPSDLEDAVAKIAGADIVEGFKTRTLTVEMDEAVANAARRRLSFCVIEPVRLLDLL